MTLRGVFRWQGGRSPLWQGLVVLLAVLYIGGLHLGNDGLWYQGDAPRHATNCLFWWDYLASFSVHPVEFALRYYARYPSINPIGYPPVFYLLEGAAFSLVDVSPFVAKGLVLAFALGAGLYLTAWLRRWVAEQAGWGGALLVLQPGNIEWANAVMLNVPSMALGLAALYHGRRWLEVPSSPHIYPAVLLGVLGTLTYIPTGIVVFVFLAWVVADRRWRLLWNRRTLALAFISVVILLPWALVVTNWTPIYVDHVFPRTSSVSRVEHWTFYLRHLPEILSSSLLGVLVLSIVVGICDRYWRREVKLILIWGIVSYIALSYMGAREARYALLLAPPAVGLCVIGLSSSVRWVAARLGGDPSQWFLAGMATLLALHVTTAPFVRVDLVDGFREVVAFVEKEAPDERIFYDGRHNGVFSFYMRAGDPDFRRGVVLGSKLLYATGIVPESFLTERVSSPAEVVEVLRTECGCRWLALESREASDRIAAAKYLRQAVKGLEFQLVRSFPIVAPLESRVDVYRFLLPIEKPDELDLPFPILGKGTIFRVTPIER